MKELVHLKLLHQAKEIGVARVYDFRLESGSYSTSNTNLNEWDIFFI
jgi:hypothetical protein